MDSSQCKDYVLVMLFIKYASDKYAGKPYAPIKIPEGASFADMVAWNTELELGAPGKAFWMREYWDRYIRDERHFHQVIDYIHRNPVQAGLCDSHEDWPRSSTAAEGSGSEILRSPELELGVPGPRLFPLGTPGSSPAPPTTTEEPNDRPCDNPHDEGGSGSLRTSVKTSVKNREKILRLIAGDPAITTAELAEQAGVTAKGIEWQIAKLKDEGRIRRIGLTEVGIGRCCNEPRWQVD